MKTSQMTETAIAETLDHIKDYFADAHATTDAHGVPCIQFKGDSKRIYWRLQFDRWMESQPFQGGASLVHPEYASQD